NTAVSLIGSGICTGIKDSGGDWEYFQELAHFRERFGFKLFMGDDRIYAQARCAGADGAVSGVACAVPELMSRIDRAIREGQPELAARLNARLHEVIAFIEPFPAPVGI